jgi:CHAT domain-containing protein
MPRSVNVSAAALDDAVRRSEAASAQPGSVIPPLDAIAVLEIAESTAAQMQPVATSEALGRYCAQAGEAMRTEPRGNTAQARSFLVAALRHAEAAGDSRTLARATYALGLASLSGDSAAAAGTRGASAAISSPDSVADPTAPADDPCIALGQAGFLRLSGVYAARAALGCTIARARGANDPVLAALAGLRLTRLVLVQAATMANIADTLRSEALGLASRALVDAQQIPDSAVQAALTARLAEAAIDAGTNDLAAISAAADRLRRLPADPAMQAFAESLDGRIALRRGNRILASRAFQQATFFEAQRAQPLMMPTWLLLLAEAEPDRRPTIVQQAYRALESIRALVPPADPVTEESSFTLRMRPVFEAAVAVELADRSGTQDQAQIASAQRIVEAYRQAELQSAFGANCVPSRDPVDPARLRIGEVLLYPILLKDRVELIFVAGGRGTGSTFARLPAGSTVSRDEIARLVDDMVTSASTGNDEEWRTASRTLYDLLIAPVESRLRPNGTLVIVPDGALRALPFAALTDADGKFLVERTRIAIAPALAYSQPGSERGNRALNVVAASLQREVTLPAGTFAKLAGTADEAGVAAGPGGAVIADFRAADLRRALARGRVDVLHLATHAAFNGRSDRSFIVANDEAIPLADLRALIGGNRVRGDELDLLVLSACETAVGDDEASMGLAGTAVQSGAESALASLWSVNDTGTVALMKGFYDRYRGGAGKAQSLRDAQLAMIASGGDAARPGIWAAFILLGGWR